MLNLLPTMQIGRNFYLPESWGDCGVGDGTGGRALFIFPLEIALSSRDDKEFFLKHHSKSLINSIKIHPEDED